MGACNLPTSEHFQFSTLTRHQRSQAGQSVDIMRFDLYTTLQTDYENQGKTHSMLILC